MPNKAKFVSVISGCIRQEDLVGRLGGEEFAVVLVDTTASDAERIANRIRNATKQIVFPSPEGAFSISCSIGVSEPHSQDRDLSACLVRADEALYQAKEGGRDKVVVKCLAQPEIGENTTATIHRLTA